MPFVALAVQISETKIIEAFRAGAKMRDREAAWGVIDINDNEWIAQYLNGTHDPAMYIFYRGGLYGDVLVPDVPADVQAKMFLREIEAGEVAPLTMLEEALQSDRVFAAKVFVSACIVTVVTSVILTLRFRARGRKQQRQQKK